MSLCSIMIVDDNDTDRELLIRQIEKARLTEKIYQADDGTTALEFLSNYEKNFEENPNEFPPILIFLDINMPLMNGFEFLEKFSDLRKGVQDYQSVVFTMFTSSEREEDKRKALSYDFVKGYIVKMPRSHEELKETIQRHFPDIKFG